MSAPNVVTIIGVTCAGYIELVPASPAHSFYLHRDGVRSDGCQGTLALSGLDSRPSARKGYPCEAGPTCFALSN